MLCELIVPNVRLIVLINCTARFVRSTNMSTSNVKNSKKIPLDFSQPPVKNGIILQYSLSMAACQRKQHNYGGG